MSGRDRLESFKVFNGQSLTASLQEDYFQGAKISFIENKDRG